MLLLLYSIIVIIAIFKNAEIKKVQGPALEWQQQTLAGRILVVSLPLSSHATKGQMPLYM